jgi:hypothetical protein
MASLLSGMVQPTGLVDTQDNGVQDLMEKAQAKIAENKEKAQDRLDKIGDKAEKLSDLGKTCGKSDSKDNVGIGGCGANTCTMANTEGCKYKNGSKIVDFKDLDVAVTVAIKNGKTSSTSSRDGKASTFQDALAILENVSGCDEWHEQCYRCVFGNKRDYETNSTKVDAADKTGTNANKSEPL